MLVLWLQHRCNGTRHAAYMDTHLVVSIVYVFSRAVRSSTFRRRKDRQLVWGCVRGRCEHMGQPRSKARTVPIINDKTVQATYSLSLARAEGVPVTACVS